MTKHVYKAGRLAGVVLIGQCDDPDIGQALKRFRDPFEAVYGSIGKPIHCDHVNVRGVPVGVTVSFEGEPTKPKKILVSALDITGSVSVDELKGQLDAIVQRRGLKELPSDLEDVEEEPIKGWRQMALKHGHLR